MKKFNPRNYTGKDRIYVPIIRHSRVSRLYIWNKDKKQYVIPSRGKSYRARRYEPFGIEEKLARREKFFFSLEEARRWQEERLINEPASPQVDKVVLEAEKYTVEDLISEWKETYWPQLRESTRIFYSKLIPFYEPLFQVEVEELTPAKIDKWIFHLKSDEFQKRYRSTRTSLEKEYDGLKAVIRWYIDTHDETRLIPPFKKRHLKMLKIKEKTRIKDRFMTGEESELWLDTMKRVSPDFYIAALVQIRQLLRVSEVFAMKWSNLDLKNRTYKMSEHVLWPRVKGSPPKIVGGTKNMKTGEYYDMPLRSEVIDLLSCMEKKENCALIFHNSGKIWNYRQIQYGYALRSDHEDKSKRSN